jgi:hypothetical protein
VIVQRVKAGLVVLWLAVSAGTAWLQATGRLG